MHEWALAEAVVSAASEVADKGGLKEVTEVVVKIGEMQQVEHEVLEFAFSQLKAGKLKNAKFTIGTVGAKFKCRVCGQEWAFNKEELDANAAEALHFVPEVAHTYIKCPKCSSPDFEVLEGRGIWLETVRGVK